uniref:Uncharacterized protein n=1 Tax=Stylonychia lemnae TaxID=5949 RepID=A0A3S6K9R8_STYLE|nr:hypothetical protein [Stylonychia lemnae]
MLDLNNNQVHSTTSQYWAFNFFFFLDIPTTDANLLSNFKYSHKIFFKKNEQKLTSRFQTTQKKFTITYNKNSPEYFLSENEKKFNLLFCKSKIKVNNKQNFPKNIWKKIFFNLKTKNKFDLFALTRIFENFKFKNESENDRNFSFRHGFISNLFNINFLRKEKIYTKLKYSRVPQYDTVSGAAAALFGGFLGFLISEKFGFELVDSGDFYFLFIYLVFTTFLARLVSKLITYEKEGHFFLSFSHFLLFYKNLSIILLNWVKSIYK